MRERERERERENIIVLINSKFKNWISTQKHP